VTENRHFVPIFPELWFNANEKRAQAIENGSICVPVLRFICDFGTKIGFFSSNLGILAPMIIRIGDSDITLTNDEQWAVDLWGKGAGPSYPLVRVGEGWSWRYHSLRSPIEYKTKTEATEAFRSYIESLARAAQKIVEAAIRPDLGLGLLPHSGLEFTDEALGDNHLLHPPQKTSGH
jgi:hypothetical protein